MAWLLGLVRLCQGEAVNGGLATTINSEELRVPAYNAERSLIWALEC